MLPYQTARKPLLGPAERLIASFERLDLDKRDIALEEQEIVLEQFSPLHTRLMRLAPAPNDETLDLMREMAAKSNVSLRIWWPGRLMVAERAESGPDSKEKRDCVEVILTEVKSPRPVEENEPSVPRRGRITNYRISETKPPRP